MRPASRNPQSVQTRPHQPPTHQKEKEKKNVKKKEKRKEKEINRKSHSGGHSQGIRVITIHPNNNNKRSKNKVKSCVGFSGKRELETGLIGKKQCKTNQF